MEAIESGRAVISKALETQPHLKLAIDAKGTAIGSWSQSEQRYVMVAAYAITGEWVSMPFELRINGQRIEHEWIPVQTA